MLCKDAVLPLILLQGGLLSNTPKRTVQGDTRGDEAREGLHWEGVLGTWQRGKGTQEDCSATWPTVSCFMLLALVSRLSLAGLSDSGSFLVVCTSLSPQGLQ